MSGSRTSWVYRASSTKTMFDGLPLYVLNGMGLDGLGGIPCYFNDFHRWEGPVAEGSSGGWVLTDATGTSTVVLGDVREGTIVITADATGSATSCLQLGSTTTGKNFGYTVGKRMWCFARLQTSTVAAGYKFFMGFGTPTTTPGNAAPTNGIFLRNGTTVNKLDIVAKEGANTTANTNIITLAAATYYVVGFYVDKLGSVHAYLDGVDVSDIVAGAAGLATLTGDATKTLQFMINQQLASATLTLDWLLMAQEI